VPAAEADALDEGNEPARGMQSWKAIYQDQDGGSLSRSFMDRTAVATGSPDDFFNLIVDDALLTAIDALPNDLREVLVLSDLRDLTDIPGNRGSYTLTAVAFGT
jgi:DNA-directed RNA polymerase specialized sigma24 family protein